MYRHWQRRWKEEREGHKGGFISTVSLYIAREMTDEGDGENR